MGGAIKIVSIGGGNGQSAVAKAIVILNKLNVQATFITSASDDGPTSTGTLSKKGNTPGHYGDITRVFRALCEVLHPNNVLQKTIAFRRGAGIAEGQSFGDLLAEVLGPAFQKALNDPLHRQGTLATIRNILNFDSARDDVVRELIREVLEHPIGADDFPQHTLCNLLLFELEQIAKEKGWPPIKALEAFHVAGGLHMQYRVLPVSWKPSVLIATTQSGDVIEGQYWIDFRDRDPNFKPYDEIVDLRLDPSVPAASEAKEAILEADIIIVSCGSIKGNVNAAFLPVGMKEALRDRARSFEESRGFPLPVVLVINLMNEPGNTLSGEPYTAEDIVDLVQQAIGRRPNRVIYDKNRISAEDKKLLLPQRRVRLGGLRKYEGLPELEWPFLIAEEVSMIVLDNDPGRRIKLVHDPDKLAKVFNRIISEVPAGALV